MSPDTTPGGPDAATTGGRQRHYRMRQKLISMRDDYWIEDDRGRRVYAVKEKFLRLRRKLVLQDVHGTDLLVIRERTAGMLDTMLIETPAGDVVATVRKALDSPVHERWRVYLADGGPDLDVKGDLLDHEYEIDDGRHRVAEVSRRWLRAADTYGIEVSPGQDPLLILAVAVIVDSTRQDDH